MFDLSLALDEPGTFAGSPHAESANAARYDGPERRASAPPMPHWSIAAFDEIDYGILLLDSNARLLHSNHIARTELDDSYPLLVRDGRLRTRDAKDAALLNEALCAASQRSLRKLLTIGEGAHRVCLSVVPLAGSRNREGGATTLVMLSKPHVCEALSVHGFARLNQLTGAETRLLLALCNGVLPRAAANQMGVAISTVRTQLGSIRAKTGAQSLRDLVRQVAVLPPLVGILRGV